jgi:hypothetical protein
VAVFSAIILPEISFLNEAVILVLQLSVTAMKSKPFTRAQEIMSSSCRLEAAVPEPVRCEDMHTLFQISPSFPLKTP